MQGLDEICPDIPRTYASRNCRNTFCYTSLIVPDRLMPIKSIFGFQEFGRNLSTAFPVGESEIAATATLVFINVVFLVANRHNVRDLSVTFCIRCHQQWYM
ncbi:conserved hypothetical protein [Trichinella spiralis]|uniref:hypothetical protein n=1 Tax=Trichinella spiralis TaxID=6334 RepID=UPI0001EFE51C|nr:conserved hypothetical protein [Trichinella spiralis]